MSRALYSNGYVALATSNPSELEWFIMDMVEQGIGLPIRLIKWHRGVAEPNEWLAPKTWRALILNFSYLDDKEKGSPRIGYSLFNLRQAKRNEDQHIYLLLSPGQFRNRDTLIKGTKIPSDYCFKVSRLYGQDYFVDLAKRMYSDLKDWNRAMGTATELPGALNQIR